MNRLRYLLGTYPTERRCQSVKYSSGLSCQSISDRAIRLTTSSLLRPLETLRHLTTSDVDDAPTHTMALIFRYWTQCKKISMRQNESGVRLNITNPYIPEPEYSSGIWKSLMCRDMAQVVDDFNRVQAPNFYAGNIDTYAPLTGSRVGHSRFV